MSPNFIAAVNRTIPNIADNIAKLTCVDIIADSSELENGKLVNSNVPIPAANVPVRKMVSTTANMGDIDGPTSLLLILIKINNKIIIYKF